jgi:hypothetical protein
MQRSRERQAACHEAEKASAKPQHRHLTLSPVAHRPHLGHTKQQEEHRRGAQAMFSARLTRAAHRATCTTTTHSSAAPSVITASSTASQYARPTSHARRHSSSKASSWPSGNSTGKPTPAAKAETLSPPKASSRQAKGKGRGASKRIAEVKKPAEPIDQYAGLPSVPAISLNLQGGLSAKSRVRLVI